MADLGFPNFDLTFQSVFGSNRIQSFRFQAGGLRGISLGGITIPDFTGTGGTTPYPPATNEAIAYVALRALLGVITGYPEELDPQVIYDGAIASLPAPVVEQINAEVAAEVPQASQAIPLEGPPSSPFVPHLPGQTPIGTNPNDPFLPGGSGDPGGPINPMRTWASTQEILDAIRRGALEVLAGRVVAALPDKLKELATYWLGIALRQIEIRIQTDRIDHATRKAMVIRQMQLQDFYNRLISPNLTFDTPEQLYAFMEGAGVPVELPKEPIPAVVRCLSCGKGACECLSDSP